jgi:hypothetical protein
MKKLGQIALGLFIVNNTVFDLINIPKNTHLSIMYFGFTYIAFMILALNLYLSQMDSFSLAIGVGFTVKLFWELSKWNMKYEDYMHSVNNYEKGLLFCFLIIALLLTAINYDKRNNRNNNGALDI